jgi:hypothetical protein
MLLLLLLVLPASFFSVKYADKKKKRAGFQRTSRSHDAVAHSTGKPSELYTL